MAQTLTIMGRQFGPSRLPWNGELEYCCNGSTEIKVKSGEKTKLVACLHESAISSKVHWKSMTLHWSYRKNIKEISGEVRVGASSIVKFECRPGSVTTHKEEVEDANSKTIEKGTVLLDLTLESAKNENEGNKNEEEMAHFTLEKLCLEWEEF